MLSIWDAKFIVIDVETTGSNPVGNSLIDIACVTTIGGTAVDRYDSLINPHQFIPPFISNMTGISNEMVYNAPESETVLAVVKDILLNKDAVFVAHNLSFDYSFVKGAFAKIEMDFPVTPKLCTLKLARRLLRKDIKKNVGSLSEYFGIKIKNRHRALGDADATSQILCELMEIAEDEHGVQSLEELLELQNKQIKNFIPPSVAQKRLQDKLDDLPEDPGVYYFKDKTGNIHYVGKAKCLKDRVKSYFQYGNVTSRKISAMLKKSHFLDWECTDSELAALIKESREIKALMPYYNTLEKDLRTFPFIRLTVAEEYPKIEITNSIEDDGSEYFGPFRSRYLAEVLIENISKQFKVRKCEGELKPNDKKRPCFYFHIERCGAPCANLITQEQYLKDVERAKYYLSGCNDGIIRQMEEKMHQFAEQLEFEKAGAMKVQIRELKKLFDKQNDTPVSVNSDNFAMTFPISDRDKLLQVFLIRSGKLDKQFTIGRKARLDDIFADVHQLYYSDDTVNIAKYSKHDINDLKIINAWVFKNKDKAKFVYFKDKTEQQATEELEYNIRNTYFEGELEDSIGDILAAKASEHYFDS